MSEYYEGIGRRKEASARVRIVVRDAGQSEAPTFVVNDKPVEEFFPRYGDVLILTGPLEAVGLAGRCLLYTSRGQRTRTNSRTSKGPKKTVAGRGRRKGGK